VFVFSWVNSWSSLWTECQHPLVTDYSTYWWPSGKRSKNVNHSDYASSPISKCALWLKCLRPFWKKCDQEVDHFYRAILCISGICYGPVSAVSVCVCPSQVEVLPKRLNVGSHKQHHTIRNSGFLTPKISAKFDRGHPYGGTKCRWGGTKSATFHKSPAISRKRYKIDAWVLLKSNRKLYALYRMVTLPMTLSAR